MAVQRNDHKDLLIEEFSKDLDFLGNQVQNLLDELRRGKENFVEIRTEIKYLIENVKNLSNIIKDGNGHSLLTRMAVVEEMIRNIRTYIEKDVENGQRLEKDLVLMRQKLDTIEDIVDDVPVQIVEKVKDNKEKPEGAASVEKWKTWAALGGGIITVITTIITIIAKANGWF